MKHTQDKGIDSYDFGTIRRRLKPLLLKKKVKMQELNDTQKPATVVPEKPYVDGLPNQAPNSPAKNPLVSYPQDASRAPSALSDAEAQADAYYEKFFGEPASQAPEEENPEQALEIEKVKNEEAIEEVKTLAKPKKVQKATSKNLKGILEGSKTLEVFEKAVELGGKSKNYLTGAGKYGADVFVEGLANTGVDILNFLRETGAINPELDEFRQFDSNIVTNEEKDKLTTGQKVIGEISSILFGVVGAGSMIGTFKRARRAGTIGKKLLVAGESMALGGVVDAVLIPTDQKNVANLLQEYPALRNVVFESLSIDDDDPKSEVRIKNLLVGAGLTGVADTVLRTAVTGVKLIKRVLKAQNSKPAKILQETVEGSHPTNVLNEADSSKEASKKAPKETDIDLEDLDKQEKAEIILNSKSLSEAETKIGVKETKRKVGQALDDSTEMSSSADYEGLANKYKSSTDINKVEGAEHLDVHKVDEATLRFYESLSEMGYKKVDLDKLRKEVEAGILRGKDPDLIDLSLIKEFHESAPSLSMPAIYKIVTTPFDKLPKKLQKAFRKWSGSKGTKSLEGLEIHDIRSAKALQKELESGTEALRKFLLTAENARIAEEAVAQEVAKLIARYNNMATRLSPAQHKAMIEQLDAFRQIFKKTRTVFSVAGKGLSEAQGAPLRGQGKSGLYKELADETTEPVPNMVQTLAERGASIDKDLKNLGQFESKQVSDFASEVLLSDMVSDDALKVLAQNPEDTYKAVVYGKSLFGDGVEEIKPKKTWIEKYKDFNNTVGDIIIGGYISGIHTKVIIPVSGTLNTVLSTVERDVIPSMIYGIKNGSSRVINKIFKNDLDGDFIPEKSKLLFALEDRRQAVKNATKNFFKNLTTRDDYSALKSINEGGEQGALGLSRMSAYQKGRYNIQSKLKEGETSQNIYTNKLMRGFMHIGDLALEGLDHLFGYKHLQSLDQFYSQINIGAEVKHRIYEDALKVYRREAKRLQGQGTKQSRAKAQKAFEKEINERAKKVMEYLDDPTIKELDPRDKRLLSESKKQIEGEVLLRDRDAKILGTDSNFNIGELSKMTSELLNYIPILGKPLGAFVGVLSSLGDQILQRVPVINYLNPAIRKQWKTQPTRAFAKTMTGLGVIGATVSHDLAESPYTDGLRVFPDKKDLLNFAQATGQYPRGVFYYNESDGRMYGFSRMDILGGLVSIGAYLNYYGDEFQDHESLTKFTVDFTTALMRNSPPGEFLMRASETLGFLSGLEQGQRNQNRFNNFINIGLINDIRNMVLEGDRPAELRRDRRGDLNASGQISEGSSVFNEGALPKTFDLTFHGFHNRLRGILQKDIIGRDDFYTPSHNWDGTVVKAPGFTLNQRTWDIGQNFLTEFGARWVNKALDTSSRYQRLNETLYEFTTAGFSQSIVPKNEAKLVLMPKCERRCDRYFKCLQREFRRSLVCESEYG